MIELLIVIVVLGILAAIVVFALGNVTGKSAAAACQSDAKTVGVGVAALTAENPTLATAGLTTAAFKTDMTATTTVTYGSPAQNLVGNPFVQTWPKSSSYTISVADASSLAVNDASATTQTAAATAAATTYGDILVTGTGSGAQSYTYDATQNPIEACNWAVTGKF